jgi:uncharacterized repeat protein (TIGR01451 family)
MKKNLQKLFLITAAAICMSATVSRAQLVTIIYADDSTQYYCGAPFTALFMVYAHANGYTSTDSVSVYHNFGDGSDTLFYVHIPQPTIYAMYTHTYQFPGVYNSLYIVTGPDGTADTLFSPNDVIDSASCGDIDGKLFIDANNNCVQDVGEADVPYAPVELWYNSQLFATTYTAANGYYYFYVPNNTYTIQPGAQIANYGYSVTCPVSGQITVSSLPSTGNNFGLTCTPGFDLSAYMWSQNFRPGFNRSINPAVHNHHCQPTSGQAKLILDGTWLTFVSAAITPDAIIGDTLIWNFTGLTNMGYFNPGPVVVYTSPSAPLGDSICVTLIAEPITGDVNPANNSITVCRPITNAYDPNEKQVNPAGDVASGSWLTYTVFFQNTGNDTAYSIFVLDTIDANLDMNTFQPIAASHAWYTYIMDGNAVKFDFPNIMLLDSNTSEPLSHGWVSYRIKTNTGLSNGTLINNTAHIYFDFNPAIVTNTTVTQIDNTVSVGEIISGENGISLSPNPASNLVTVSTAEFEIASVEVFDVLGNKIGSGLPADEKYVMDVSGFAQGIYFVKVKSGKAESVIKFVKQ